MPINPSIALQFRPPQIADNIARQQLAQQQLVNDQTDNQLRQQQVVGLQQQNQLTANQMRDAQAMQRAFQQWDGSSLDSLLPAAKQNGISASGYMALSANIRKQKEEIQSQAKANGEAFQSKLNMEDQLAQELMQIPDQQQRAALWAQRVPQMEQTGLFKPGELPQQYSDMWLQMQPKASNAVKQAAMEQQGKQAVIDKNVAQTDLYKQQSLPTAAREYQFAKGQGFQGTFADYQKQQAQLTHPPVPGRDVPFPPAVQAQRMAAGQSRYSSTAQDVGDTAQAIYGGQASPVLTEYSFRDRTAIMGQLKRLGYNQAKAEQDWKATQRYLSTLNGSQQLRLRQAVDFTQESLPVLSDLYDKWKQAAGSSGVKLFNRASLAASKQLPGDAGQYAHQLEAQIADLTSELGTVYKGGNSSTDESLKLAAQNLQADWNEQTFKAALGQIETNLRIRKNSIFGGAPAGVAPNSQYTPSQQAPDANVPPAGAKIRDYTELK